MFILLLEISLVINMAAGLDSVPLERSDERTQRFITFNNDESNIRLEMVFAIPFLQIPVGHSSGTSVRPTVDINLKSFVVAGMVFFLLFFIIPGLIRVTIPNSSVTPGWHNSEASKMLERMEKSLTQYGIDSHTCLNDGMCYVLQTAKGNMMRGQASSWDKIIDGIVSNNWIHPLLPNQLTLTDCSQNYTCPIMGYNFTNIFTNIMQKMKKMNMRLPNFNSFNLG